MGVTSLESLDDLIAVNRINYEHYRTGLNGAAGLTVLEYPTAERCNYHYVVVRVDADASGLTRDDLVQVLHAERVLARRYFWPGCHRMQPYAALFPNAYLLLPRTELRAAQLMVLPTGEAVAASDIAGVCDIVRTALQHAGDVKDAIGGKRAGRLAT
jgi:dTDP-4-amino-4,6-dideoxygalactose transaminase